MHLKFEASFWKYEKKKKIMSKEMEVYQFNKYKFYNHLKNMECILIVKLIFKFKFYDYLTSLVWE
jgi:hypothetical protein